MVLARGSRIPSLNYHSEDKSRRLFPIIVKIVDSVWTMLSDPQIGSANIKSLCKYLVGEFC